MTRSALAIILAAVLAFVACKPLQEAHPQQTQDAPSAATLASQDRTFLERAAEGNNGEISIGALAEGRTMRREVLAYGVMMVNEHGAANAQLAAIARAKNITLPSSPGEHQKGFDQVVNLRGSEFDEKFLRVMIADHQQAKLLYSDEISSGVDPQLREYAASMLPKIEAHLAQAEALLDQLQTE